MNKILKTFLIVIIGINLNALEMIKLDTKEVNSRVFGEDCPNCKLILVSLDVLISQIIKNNYDLNSQKMKVDIATHQTAIEEGIFEPILNLKADYIRTKVPNSAEDMISRNYLSIYEEDRYYAQAGVKGIIESGAEWSINISDGRKNSNLIEETRDYRNEFDNEVSFSLKQPLLKGFGKEMTSIKINLAKQNETIVLKEYNTKLMNLIASTVKTYWTLYGTQKLYESWKNSLVVAQKGLKNIKLLALNGKMPETDVIEVRSAILHRKTEILALKSRIIELQDKIMSLLNLSVMANPNIILITKDSPHIEKKVKVDPLSVSFEKALNNLPELELIKLKYKQEKLKNSYSENQLLPDLSIQAGISTAGLGSLDSTARKDAFSDKYTSYNVGLSLEMPIGGNKQAKENLAISKLKLLDAKLEIESSKRMLNNVLNTKRKQLLNQQDRLDLYKENMSFNTDLLNIELKKLRSGRADIRDVFDYEEKVILSQRKLLNSIINWKLSEALLDKSTGELFKKYKIRVDVNRAGYSMIEDKLNKKLYK
jgi:outer membrane protein TolC